ncbi:MAG TPA: ABC transporter permease [Vicinamibacterales bacterium]|nr:ABC transporter permease [Vicinamibacterales bacterium]
MRMLLAVARKELRQIVRDRRTVLIQAFVPAFFLVVFGYALSFDIRHIALAVEDRDGTPQSRALVSAFVNSGYFDFAAAVRGPRWQDRLLDTNEARAVLVIPEGFARTASTGGSAPVQVIVNGDNANTATAVIGYATGILHSAALQFAPGSPMLDARRGEARVPLVMEPRVWYNPELRSALFLVPGLIAYISMLMAVTSTALSIVREKESGTMEQVRMAPVRTVPFLLGKTLPYFCIALLSAGLVFLASMALFDLPMRGSWLTLAGVLSLYLAGALATGLLVSTVADTQQVAFQIALLVSLLPTLMLSGFIFPIASMPAFLQAVTHIVPARYFLVALRAIVLKGSSVLQLLPQIGALAVYALVVLGLASVRLSRERA